MIIRGKEKWKKVIEAQKQSGLTIKKYCNDNPICISSFYKQKALILDEENIFIPVIIDKSNDVIDFDIDRHRIFCSKQNFKILLENLLCLSIMIKNIYVAKQFCDMRKQIDDLALIVTSQFSMNVLDHSLFIFTDFSPSYIWLRRIIMSV